MKQINLLGVVLVALFVGIFGASHAEDKVAKLVIIKAEYGDLPDGTKADVTEKVKPMVNGDGLSVAATNDNFGDPVEGTTKKLRVDYTLDDVTLSRTVNENDTLTIATKPSKIKIVKAEYGDLPSGTKTDVTAKVQSMVTGHSLSIEASNTNFGDPIEGTGKKLKVEYTFEGGAAKSKEVAEGETLSISDKGE